MSRSSQFATYDILKKIVMFYSASTQVSQESKYTK